MDTFNCSYFNTTLQFLPFVYLVQNSVPLVLASFLLHTLLVGFWLICIGGRRIRERCIVCMCGGHRVGADLEDSVPDFEIDGDEAMAGATRTASAPRAPRTQRAHHRTILKPESTWATVAVSELWGMVLAPDILVRTSSLSPEAEATSSSEALAGGTSSAGSEPEVVLTMTSENETESGAADGVATASPSTRAHFMHHERNTCGPPTSGGPLPEFLPRASAAKKTATVTRLFKGNDETEEIELSELGAGAACGSGSASASAAQSPECARAELVARTHQRSPTWSTPAHELPACESRATSAKLSHPSLNSAGLEERVSSRANRERVRAGGRCGRVPATRLQQAPLASTGSATLSGPDSSHDIGMCLNLNSFVSH